MASSPSFELQELINENRQWVQTYGNSTEGLKTSYTDILSTNYISDGKTLNTTVWLYSGFSNSSSAYDEIYNAPDAYSNLSSAKLSYGILIDSDANTRTGYNGADYDFYAELYEGKLNVYLYQLSSTGGYKLVGSKSNLTFSHAESPVGPGYANLNLDLSSIGYPSEYNLLFYSAESIGSNEVRQFTNWVTIPPPSLEISTSPSDISIRQGEEQMIPARIKSTSGFSNDVINITLGVTNNFNDNFNDYIIGSSFNSSEFDVHIQRNQPPLIKIGVPNQTPLGIYTIPLIVTIREPSMATATKPTFTAPLGGTVDPKFALSVKYPTVGYLTKPINLTVTVIPPKGIGDQFKDFWATYGQFIGIFAGAFVGAFAKQMFDKAKQREEKE
ncbi:MAG: hypothetical protein AB7U98_02825 [Candidatus Nitrosocosmicus sp.]|jgi:hypothetical protein|nr:hypothetical protein [Candidatus Nitrosocosmicus sp.]